MDWRAAGKKSWETRRSRLAWDEIRQHFDTDDKKWARALVSAYFEAHYCHTVMDFSGGGGFAEYLHARRQWELRRWGAIPPGEYDPELVSVERDAHLWPALKEHARQLRYRVHCGPLSSFEWEDQDGGHRPTGAWLDYCGPLTDSACRDIQRVLPFLQALVVTLQCAHDPALATYRHTALPVELMRLTSWAVDFAVMYRAVGGRNQMMLLGLCPKSQLEHDVSYGAGRVAVGLNPRLSDWRMERDPYELADVLARQGYWYASDGSCSRRLAQRSPFVGILECWRNGNPWGVPRSLRDILGVPDPYVQGTEQVA